MNFKKKALVKERSEFNPKDGVGEIVEFVRLQRVPGEVKIVLPGNGGISSVTFHGKEQVRDVEEQTS